MMYGTRTIPESIRQETIARAAAQYGVRPRDIESGCRVRQIAHARQLAMWMLRQRRNPVGAPSHSFPAIARAVGLKDHTTARHACFAVEARLEQERAA